MSREVSLESNRTLNLWSKASMQQQFGWCLLRWERFCCWQFMIITLRWCTMRILWCGSRSFVAEYSGVLANFDLSGILCELFSSLWISKSSKSRPLEALHTNWIPDVYLRSSCTHLSDTRKQPVFLAWDKDNEEMSNVPNARANKCQISNWAFSTR